MSHLLIARTLRLAVFASLLLALGDHVGSAAPGADDEQEVCLLTWGADVGVHHGTHAPEPRAFVGGTLYGDTHRYWLKFDLGVLPDNVDRITGATLTLTAGRKSVLAIGVATGDDDWDAMSLDWDSQPAFDFPTAVEEYTFVENQAYTWDVTDHVAFEVEQGDPTLSLVLLQVPEGERTGNVWFYTHDYATSDDQRPQLCIRYTVRSDTPPEVTVGEPLVLACPRHDMRSVELASLATALDAEDGVLDLQASGRITYVTSNESDDTGCGGDGRTEGDICVLGPATVELRAEREGDGEGRVYTIGFVVTDSSGNETAAEALVFVPHDDASAWDGTGSRSRASGSSSSAQGRASSR